MQGMLVRDGLDAVEEIARLVEIATTKDGRPRQQVNARQFE